jgi:hypothetical protein
MITERRPDVSPFSAIESIANWLSGTFTSQPLRSRIEWRLCEGQSGALTDPDPTAAGDSHRPTLEGIETKTAGARSWANQTCASVVVGRF